MSRAGITGDGPEGPKQPCPGSTAVLSQCKNAPKSPVKMAMGGFVVVATIGYLVLCAKKKPEVSALEVAQVSTGVGLTENRASRK